MEKAGVPAGAGRQVELVRFARNAAGRILFSVEGDANELRDGKAVPVDWASLASRVMCGECVPRPLAAVGGAGWPHPPVAEWNVVRRSRALGRE